MTINRKDLEEAIQNKTDIHDFVMVGQNLSGLDLSYLDLSDADLSACNLSNTNFSNSTFTAATIIGANCENANFSGCDLSYAKLNSTNFENATLDHAIMSCTEGLDSCNLKNASFEKASLSTEIHTILTKRKEAQHFLAKQKQEDYKAIKTILRRTDGSIIHSSHRDRKDTLIEAIEEEKDISDIDLSGVKLDGFDFSNLSLRKASFYKADISGANFTDADIEYANFSFANATSANFTRANIKGAVFSYAILNFSNFLNALIGGGSTATVFHYAQFHNMIAPNGMLLTISKPENNPTMKTTVRNKKGDVLFESNKSNIKDALTEAIRAGTDLREVDLAGAHIAYMDFSGLDLRRANFNRAHCSFATFDDTNLIDASFVGAGLHDAKFNRAIMTNTNMNNTIFEDKLGSKAQPKGEKTMVASSTAKVVATKDEKSKQAYPYYIDGMPVKFCYLRKRENIFPTKLGFSRGSPTAMIASAIDKETGCVIFAVSSCNTNGIIVEGCKSCSDVRMCKRHKGDTFSKSWARKLALGRLEARPIAVKLEKGMSGHDINALIMQTIISMKDNKVFQTYVDQVCDYRGYAKPELGFDKERYELYKLMNSQFGGDTHTLHSAGRTLRMLCREWLDRAFGAEATYAEVRGYYRDWQFVDGVSLTNEKKSLTFFINNWNMENRLPKRINGLSVKVVFTGEKSNGQAIPDKTISAAPSNGNGNGKAHGSSLYSVPASLQADALEAGMHLRENN